MIVNTSKKNNDRVYFNVVLNSGDSNTNTYYKNFSEPIIDNPSEYHFSITRLEAPTLSVPVFIPRIMTQQNQLDNYGNLNQDRTVYELRLKRGNYQSDVIPVIHKSSFPNVQNSFPVNGDYNLENTTAYYFYYNYRTFMLQVNEALVNALNSLNQVLTNAGQPTIPNTEYPRIYFDVDTSLFRIEFPFDYYLSSNANRVELLFNQDLYDLFDGIEFTAFTNDVRTGGVRIEVYDFGDNVSGGIVSMVQEYKSISNWLPLRSIFITSNYLPVTYTYSSVQNTEKLSGQNIVIDFVVTSENVTGESRNSVSYFINSSYLLYDLVGSYGLKTLDFQFFWTDFIGNTHRLIIPKEKSLTMKIVFIRKGSDI